MALSNQFGAAFSSQVNQNGDYAFIGTAATSVFLRRAGMGLQRVFQMNDEVPGFPGSLADITQFLRINNSGSIVFNTDFSRADGTFSGALLKFDGTSLTAVVTGSDTAPSSGGATYGRLITGIGFNDNGDVSFTAPLSNNIGALFIIPGGGSAVRLAAAGDGAPGTVYTFGTITGLGMNAGGEVLFRSTLTGAPPNTQGLFVASTSGVRKVMVSGEAAPPSGNFGLPNTAFINNAGQVGFIAGAVYVNTVATGNTRVMSGGESVPAPVGGTIASGNLVGFSDAGDLILNASVASTPNNSAVLRKRPGGSLEVAGYRNQPAPGAPGQAFDQFTAVSVNSTGQTTFRASLQGAGVPFGVFQQTGVGAPTSVVLDGQATGLSGGGNFSFANTTITRTLNNGSVQFGSEVPNGSADYGEFLVGGGTTALMNTGDTLPAGSRVVTRNFRVGASGNFVAFQTQNTGGRFNIAVHNITTHETTVVVGDGDAAASLGGGRVRITSRNVAFVNSTGTVTFSANVIGGPSNGSGAILTVAPGGPISKIVVGGELDSATGRTFITPTLNTVSPSPINDSGQVVFTTGLLGAGGIFRGVYVGSVGSAPQRIVSQEQLMGDGRRFFALQGNTSLSIDTTGRVGFLCATIGGGSGLYFGVPTGTPAKVAATGDLAPGGLGGATFTGFSVPSVNNNGKFAFGAILSNAPGAGVYTGSTSAPPVAIALNGGASPAGGSFSFSTTTARAEAAINDQEDVVLRADLFEGPGTSGYFIRRGPGGLLQTLVLQGQSAPGTSGGTFGNFIPSPNNLVHELFQLSPDGEVAFLNTFTTAASTPGTGGFWRVGTDGSIQLIMVRASLAPEFGGGTPVSSSTATVWNSNGRFAVFGRITGGTFTDGIFLSVPEVPINTPPGASVPVTTVDSTTGTTPVNLTFDNVTTAGATTLTTSSGGPAIPNAFALGDPPIFYNIETTATFAGSINICIDFSAASFPPGSNLRLLHFDGTSWVDVTSSPPSGNIICGSVTSLSPFTVVEVLNSPPTADAGANQTVECTSPSGCTFTLDGSNSSDPDLDTLGYVWKDGLGNVVGNSAVISVTRPLGTYTFSLTVTDTANQSSTATTQVVVRDTVAPSLAISMSPHDLWPANNRMVEVSATITVNDTCDANPAVKLISITSNEALASGDIQGAALNTDDRSFQLRATRAGNGPGRTYTITYRATDASGNFTIGTATVLVPHDQGN
ncbi:MAG TPA: PKD domain-containing protein [Pyrinomonadaceae bacterium]|nr:PKD domain-containing protein [Pyrinomonadaceae bacterium]